MQWSAALFGGTILLGTAELLRRAGRLPGGLVGSLLIAHVLLLITALFLQLSGIPITWLPCTLVFGGLGLGGTSVLLWRRAKASPSSADSSLPLSPSVGRPFGWAIGIAAVLVVAFALRYASRPLMGADVHWRWDHLARLILLRQELGFYPPQTSADYEVYLYPESIPPLVSVTYWWLYAWANVPPADWSQGARLTTLLVTLQYVVCLALAYDVGARLAIDGVSDTSPRTSRISGTTAMLLLAATPLLQRSILIGQEGGLLTVSVLAMASFALRVTPQAWARPTIMAGVAGAVASLSREYGPAFALCVLPVVGWRARSWRAVLLCTMTCAVPAGPWYVRTWVRTGNPIFSLPMLGLPTNPLHMQIMDAYADALGWRTHAGDILLSAVQLVGYEGLLAFVLGVVGVAMIGRRHRWIAAWAGVGIVLWAMSVPRTSGGYVYSFRVLAPALALLAVLGAARVVAPWLLKRRSGRREIALIVGLLGLGWSMTLLIAYPVQPWQTPHVPPEILVKRQVAYPDWNPSLARVSRLPAGSVLVTDEATQQAFAHARQLPIMVSPIWGPRAEPLFDSSTSDMAETLRQLRRAGVTHVWVDGRSLNARAIARQSPLMHDLYQRLEEIGLREGVIFQLTPDNTLEPLLPSGPVSRS